DRRADRPFRNGPQCNLCLAGVRSRSGGNALRAFRAFADRTFPVVQPAFLAWSCTSGAASQRLRQPPVGHWRRRRKSLLWRRKHCIVGGKAGWLRAGCMGRVSRTALVAAQLRSEALQRSGAVSRRLVAALYARPNGHSSLDEGAIVL